MLLKCEDKEKCLNEALNAWYEKHSDAYWYNAHEASNDTYCGYWCFEIAALARILGINDALFRENQFYPYEIER